MEKNVLYKIRKLKRRMMQVVKNISVVKMQQAANLFSPQKNHQTINSFCVFAKAVFTPFTSSLSS